MCHHLAGNGWIKEMVRHRACDMKCGFND
jgi:hypothetical protein